MRFVGCWFKIYKPFNNQISINENRFPILRCSLRKKIKDTGWCRRTVSKAPRVNRDTVTGVVPIYMSVNEFIGVKIRWHFLKLFVLRNYYISTTVLGWKWIVERAVPALISVHNKGHRLITCQTICLNHYSCRSLDIVFVLPMSEN